MPKKKQTKQKQEKPKTETAQLTTDPARFLLRGPMPELSKMSKQSLLEECKMWRNIWTWVPDEVKYYVARTGQLVGATMRNYKRYLGVLLETHWSLEEIEIGTYDKIYDPRDGQYYFERKIVKLKANSLIDLQWIAERKTETEVMGEAAKQMKAEAEPEKHTQYDITQTQEYGHNVPPPNNTK